MPHENTPSCRQSLLETFAGTLDMMAFITPEPVETPLTPPESSFYISMSFSGRVSGNIVMIAPQSFGLMLASNLLGTAPDDPEANQRALDSLKELVNIVGGALMPHLGDVRSDTFNLGLPKAYPLTKLEEWQSVTGSENASVLSADGALLVIAVLPLNEPVGIAA